MASTQFKVNQLAKDMGIKSKDITDILSKHKIDAKSQKTLESDEFDLVFNTLTKANQIENIEDYIDGFTYIPSIKKEAQKNPPAENEAKSEEASPKKAEEKPIEAKPEAKSETKAEAKSEIKAEAKPEAKAEAKPEAKAEAKPEAKAEAKPEVKSEAKPEAEAEAKTAAKATATAQTKPEAKAEAKPEAKTAPQENNQRPARSTSNNTFAKDEERRSGSFDNRISTAQNATRPQQKPAAYQQGADNKGTGNNNSPRQAHQYGAQGNQNGYQPRGQYQGGGQQQGGYQSRPQGAGQNGNQWGQNTQGAQGGFSQKPKFDRNQHQSNNSKIIDKGDYVQSAPREKFQPQPIIRSQTPKGGDPVQKQRGATRVVDTRAGQVDLSKYDERLDNFVPDAVRDIRGGNQKLKKQNGSNRQPQESKQQNKNNKKSHNVVKPQKINISIPDEITVSELASRLKITAGEVVKRLMMMGMMVTVNQTIDYDTAYLIADEFGAIVTKEVVVTIEEKLFESETDAEESLQPRAPVVCVMGHVDHGKTSLLDAIRNTRVTSGEAGGITQHIGAYRVDIDGKDITFLDTPGHEAFTAMRARGAQATDIAILVVAADDGIMPQTVEAINHAKAANIDIIVAINKMDKPTANPDAIKQELTKYDLVPEEWGGDVMCVPVSALTHQGVDELLETVLLVAEVKELKANPNRRAKGIVIEAKLDKGRGPVATVLVQNGTLRSGDTVIAGTSVGHVRAMTDHNGRVVKVATPSVPVEITGLSEVPKAGDEFNAVEDERMAKELADRRRASAKEEVFRANARATLNDLFAQISEGKKDLNVIVKADVGGSAEAVKASLEKLSNEEVQVKVIHSAAGGITEGDVMFGAASNAIIVGFNVRPDKAALDLAEDQGVEVRTYRVIYECIEEITAAMKGMLAPKFKETINGHADVRAAIKVPGVGTIAGSYILDGKIARSNMIRVLRDGVVIAEDQISSLRRFKDDVREVMQGYECGIGLEKFNDIKVGDIFEVYFMEEIKD